MFNFVSPAAMTAPRCRSNAWTISALASFVVLTLAVVLERLPTIGFAYLNVDESAYLMIGAAMRHGAIPYIDIVDRKPVGLYLIYALADAIFPDPIVGARVLGLFCTLASAGLIAFIGRRFLHLSRPAATLAGIFFSCYAILCGGDAAQYNVFVMPFVVAAAAIVFGTLTRLAEGQRPSAAAVGLAGLSIGLAMQIKYTPAFEGIGFGTLLIFAGWRYRASMDTQSRRALIRGLIAMVAGGLLPTLAAAAVYWRLGHLDAFIFYNFTVNLGRTATDYSPGLLWFRIAEIAFILHPLAIFSVLYVAKAAKGTLASERQPPFIEAALAIWLIAALAAALVQRQPYLHYFYAVVPPLALCAAGALQGRDRPFSKAAGTLVALYLVLPVLGYAGGWRYETATHGSAMLPRQIAKDLQAAHVHSLYDFNYFGILYYLSGLEAPTRYTLPTHLLRDLEAASFQFDARAEVGRILASHPEVIAVVQPFATNIAADRVVALNAALQENYCTWRTYDAGQDTVYLYRFAGRGGGACAQDADAPVGTEGVP